MAKRVRSARSKRELLSHAVLDSVSGGLELSYHPLPNFQGWDTAQPLNYMINSVPVTANLHADGNTLHVSDFQTWRNANREYPSSTAVRGAVNEIETAAAAQGFDRVAWSSQSGGRDWTNPITGEYEYVPKTWTSDVSRIDLSTDPSLRAPAEGAGPGLRMAAGAAGGGALVMLGVYGDHYVQDHPEPSLTKDVIVATQNVQNALSNNAFPVFQVVSGATHEVGTNTLESFGVSPKTASRVMDYVAAGAGYGAELAANVFVPGYIEANGVMVGLNAASKVSQYFGGPSLTPNENLWAKAYHSVTGSTDEQSGTYVAPGDNGEPQNYPIAGDSLKAYQAGMDVAAKQGPVEDWRLDDGARALGENTGEVVSREASGEFADAGGFDQLQDGEYAKMMNAVAADPPTEPVEDDA